MKPILCDTTKNLTQLVADNSNGLGRIDALRCIVIEERNGVYELEFDVSTDDAHFNDIAIGGIVKCTGFQNSGLQMFRIYSITKPINEVCTVYAQHISYDLNKIAVKPFNATGMTQTLQLLKSNMLGTYPFTFYSDISNSTSKFNLLVPHTVRECLGGMEGSLLDVFASRGSGEYLFDNTQVKFLAHRGIDNHVKISYGKNLTDFKQEESIENVYDAIVGFATVNEVTTTGDVQNITGAAYPRTMIVDLSQQFNDGTSVTKAKLNELARKYATDNSINVPKVSLDVSFVELSKTEEYKDIAPLEMVQLCDTVHVFFQKLNVEASAKVIKTTWNVLLERYDSIELGDAKSTISSTIQSTLIEPVEKKNADATNIVSDEMNTMAKLILNGLGLFKTEVKQSNGSLKIYMHNRPDLAESNIQYVIGETGFMVSTDYGRTWNSGIDADGNAVFNSLSSNTIKAMNIYGSIINGSRFESANGLFYLSIWAGVFKMLYDDLYVRGTLYQTQGSGNLVLMGGSSTDTNVNPSDDYSLRMTKRSMHFYRNNDTTNFPYFYFWDTDVFGLYRGNSKIELYADGKIGIYRDNTKIEIGTDGGASVTNGARSIGINGTSGDVFVQNGNSFLSIDNSGKLYVNVKSLDVFINGRGYNNLGFVNDGNGHAVIGK